ncbi:hypothetical protein V8B97DRAFT_2026831 [Scleroderma yunnanense]
MPKKASLCLVKQKIQFELATMGVSFQDDLWMNILEHIAMSPTGWQDVQVAWQNVGDAMDTVFGEQFVWEEWEDIFDPMYQVWVEEEEMKPHQRSNYDLNMHLFNLGVIDLTGTKAGPLKLLQDSDSSTDTKSLNITQEGNAQAGPLRISQKGYDSVEAGQKISQKWMWPENPFLNLYAAEDKEESTDTDTGSDTPIVGPLKVSEVLPAGWNTFASHINNICCHYEGGYTRHAGLNVSLGSLFLSNSLAEGAASYIWHALQLKSFKVTPGYNHSLYIKAMSPKAIKTSLPPSHCSIHGVYCNDVGYVLSCARFAVTMLEVVELPHPDDLAFHVLAGINPSLICWTIAMFLAQLWQEGELVNTSGRIISVYLQNQSAVINIDSDEGLVVYSCLISHLQCMHRHEDWVKIFAGPDRGIEGCIVNYVGEHLTLKVTANFKKIIVDSHQKKPLNKPKVVMALNIKMVTSLTQCEETLP